MSRIASVDKVQNIYEEINNLFLLVSREVINPLDVKAFNDFGWGLINRIKVNPIKDEYIGKYYNILLELNKKIHIDNHVESKGVIARRKKQKILISRNKKHIY